MDCCANAMAMGRIVCPKPRRVSSYNSLNSAAPMRFHACNDAVAFDSKPGAESLDLILRKDDLEAEHCASRPPSPPYIFGSPPCRAPNPLVQDAHFGVGKATMVLSTFCSASPPTSPSSVKLGNKQAAVRVEGFACRSTCAVATMSRVQGTMHLKPS